MVCVICKQLSGAGELVTSRRAVQVVAEHEQEGLAADELARREKGVSEAFLRGLRHDLHLDSDVKNALRVPGQVDGGRERRERRWRGVNEQN